MRFQFVGDDPRDAISSRGLGRMLDKWSRGSDDYSLQKFFVYEHIVEFFQTLEERYLQKILEDICYILSKGWGVEICRADFYHGHVCGKSKKVVTDLDSLLSPSNVCFLYHTFEFEPRQPQASNRSIISFPETRPQPVFPNRGVDYITKSYGVSSRDLGLMEYARIYFERNNNGPYKLKDGRTIDLWGKFP